MQNPAVSVICATRNRPGLLFQALRSIRAQSFTDTEVLVLDDGSDPAVFDQYARDWSELDDRFRLIAIRPPGSRGAGPSQARNHGIPLARGEFVTFVDDDDWWVDREHLAIAVDAMQKTSAGYYFANMRGIRSGVVVIDDWFGGETALTRGPLVPGTDSVHELTVQDFASVMTRRMVHPDSAVVRRELLTRVGGFYERATYAEDYDLMMRLADRASRILYRAATVAHYRLPEADSVSAGNSAMSGALQTIMCTQHVRSLCRTVEIRRAARAREGWNLRYVATLLHAEGHSAEALSFAWQGLMTYPTLGGLRDLARAMYRALAANMIKVEGRV